MHILLVKFKIQENKQSKKIDTINNNDVCKALDK